MEDLYLNEKIENEKIKKVLEDLFPDLVVFHYDFNFDPPEELNLENPLHIFFNTLLQIDKKQYTFQIKIFRTSSANESQRGLYIAQKLASDHSVSVLVPFTVYELKNPLCNILFQENRSFIVEYNNPNSNDRINNVVTVKKEYTLPVIKFDTKGKYIYTITDL